jgi:hypothetical protein
VARDTASLIAIGLGRTRAGKAKGGRDPQRKDSVYRPVDDDEGQPSGVRAFRKGGYVGSDPGDDASDDDDGLEYSDGGPDDDVESQEPESEERDEGPIDESYEHEGLAVRDLADALGVDPKRVDVKRACEAIRALVELARDDR